MDNPNNPYFMTPNQRMQRINDQAAIAIGGQQAAQRAAEDRARWVAEHPKGEPYPPDVTPTPTWLKVLGWVLVIYVGGSCLLIFIAFIAVAIYQMSTGHMIGVNTPTTPPSP